jgi:hypothetical protein
LACRCCVQLLLLLLQNEDAEELMRQVEREEEATAAAHPEGLQLHLCIINLVIGTLYCSKVRWLGLMHVCSAAPVRTEPVGSCFV